MKLGRLHVVLSLVVLAIAILYNVWMLTRPARSAGGLRSEPALMEGIQTSGPSVTGEAVAEVIDPTTLPPVPEVGLDRAPEWPRNPFLSAGLRLVEAPQASGEADAEPDLVLASILYSAERQLAIVNGRIVRVGDRVGTVTIYDIKPRAVIVESQDGARRTLELRVPIRRAAR